MSPVQDPPLSAATAVPPGHPQTTADAPGHPAPAPPEQPTPVAAPPTAHHPAPSTQPAPPASQPAPMDMDGDDVAAHECMMHMQHASTAATCRVSLSGGVPVDVVCGGGCFEFSRNSPGTMHAPTDPNTEDATLQETARGDTCAEVDGKAAAAARSADVPPSERLPAVLCWVVPAATTCAADAAGSQHAVCALVDTGGGPQGTVTAVDVMAAGTGAQPCMCPPVHSPVCVHQCAPLPEMSWCGSAVVAWGGDCGVGLVCNLQTSPSFVPQNLPFWHSP